MVIERNGYTGVVKQGSRLEKKYLLIGASFCPAYQLDLCHHINRVLDIVIKHKVRKLFFKFVEDHLLKVGELDQSELDPERVVGIDPPAFGREFGLQSPYPVNQKIILVFNRKPAIILSVKKLLHQFIGHNGYQYRAISRK